MRALAIAAIEFYTAVYFAGTHTHTHTHTHRALPCKFRRKASVLRVEENYQTRRPLFFLIDVGVCVCVYFFLFLCTRDAAEICATIDRADDSMTGK